MTICNRRGEETI